MPPLVRWSDVVREAVGDVAALVFPVECAGCGAGDVSLCAVCDRALFPDPVTRTIAGVPVRSALRFGGTAARVIRTMKEDGRTSLAGPLGRALAEVVDSMGIDEKSGIRFVPVPSSRAAFRRRGFRPVETIMRRARLPVTRAIVPTRTLLDQRGLGVSERAANLARAFAARPVADARVIVVDDVVTTGATLAEAVRALRQAGAEVCGGVVVADTPRRSVFADGEAGRSAIGA
ncbi:phosphoribosyltransferase family protein [Microbacterium sp. SSW1-59]|uniref:ComF family protein n=1 Tax=Microbacterium xanthum TaxID=3079794 RepID=UPI002AD4FAA2|nr:phosphoribosyltransferase family protein [Microbacterium sp. SSW1-59]MDZ8201610.1 phosphoribosyltransferase family protein [Microbacterium sp. SSW1-59]